MPLRPAPLACQQFVELVGGYLDRSLPPRLLRAVDAHLRGCEECKEYLAQIRRTSIVLAALGVSVPIPPDLLDRLSAAFDEANALGLQDGQDP